MSEQVTKPDFSSAEPKISLLAMRIYLHLQGFSYRPIWGITEDLGISDAPNHCGSGEWTETDTAMKQLLDAGLIKELPDLHCRYRVVSEAPNE